LSPEERDLAIHLRTNHLLYESLMRFIGAKIEGRAKLPVPSDPLKSHTRLVADSELRWLMSRLEHIYRSPDESPANDGGEQPG